MDSFTKQWDLRTIILYSIMALVGALCFFWAKKREEKTGEKQKILSVPYITWIVVWTLLASLRLVEEGIGGTDAVMYREYFQICLSDSIPTYYQHYDILYKLFNIIIRFFTSDYHIFFIFFYSFLTYSYILFLNEFSSKKVNIAPYLLTFFLFLRGFNTFRSNMAISFILIALVLYRKDKKIWAYLLMILTFFIQKASLLYSIPLLIFLQFFEKKEIKVRYYVIIASIGFFVGRIAQFLLINVVGSDMNGAYSAYAKRSLNSSFFDNFWKICFGQLVLLFVMIFLNKKLLKNWNKENKEDKYKYRLLYLICIYDFITIPITYILSIWRGYEFLYIPRLIMWNEILNLVKKDEKLFMQRIINIVAVIIFISWFIFRINNTFEDSSLMPYIFEPLLLIGG